MEPAIGYGRFLMDKRLFDEMIATRRTLHKRPEEGWTEFETTWLIVNRLKEIGYTKILTGTQVIDPASVLGRSEKTVKAAIERAVAQGVPQSFIDSIKGYTGAMAVLETGRPGKVTAMRFDIDGLPVQETDAPEHEANTEGFRSERDGFMHACGHDGHTAVGLALARWAFENKDKLNGTIKFLFQPAEEGVRGAAAMVGAGLVDDVDYILGCHIGGMPKLHETAIDYNDKLSTTKLDIHFKGKPSHAGNSPEQGRSALMAACATAMMMAGISRHSGGVTRVCVGKLIAGEGRNVTPVNATLLAEVRGETGEINDFMVQNVENIVKGNAVAYGVESEVVCAGRATSLPVCSDVQDICREVMQSMPEITKIHELKKMGGSDDFTNLAVRVVEKGGRCGMFRFGCNHHGHHKADFAIQDTESLPIGFGVFKGFLERING